MSRRDKPYVRALDAQLADAGLIRFSKAADALGVSTAHVRVMALDGRLQRRCIHFGTQRVWGIDAEHCEALRRTVDA